ncbi:MAG: glycosyltransferase family 4 protein [Planctomycetia bacterium]|nr:glycosyltransferase family 4 protein [Planctomycetia bacterium]
MNDIPRRPRVLMLAYSCLPYRGSEPGMGWNRALEAAKYCDVTLLTHDEWSSHSIRDYLETHGPIPGLQFEYVPTPKWEFLLARVPGMSYLAYNLWHRRAIRVARRLHERIGFDLSHLVTFCTYREPGYLLELGIPFVWGPVGGTQNYPWRFLREAGPLEACREVLRNVVNVLQIRFSPRIRHAAKKAAVLMVATSTAQRDFAVSHQVPTVLMPETGIRQLVTVNRQSSARSPELRLLWCGVLETRKALPLLLRAMKQLPAGFPVTLRVVGSGPRQGRWQRLAERLGVADKVEWLGEVPHEMALAQYEWADVFTFTSLRDTTGTVVLEALGAGLPLLYLDHQGVHDAVPPSCGVRIAVTHPRKVIDDLTAAIIQLTHDPEQRQRMGRAATERARDYLWSHLGEEMFAVYQRVLETRLSEAAPTDKKFYLDAPSAGVGAPREDVVTVR